ncbi:PilZ domain-containing protein [Parasphingorhabdus sp. JC815]|uniref:PilZ domain-containing protein n=1 Tax=Parasphingorhabdus sp. JC815 TaxID=3232140 RepID=UPI003458867E
MREPFDENLGKNNQTSGMPKRELERDSLFLHATLRFVEGDDCGEVRIRNLSAGGLMAEAPVVAKRGDKVELELRNIGRITGKVAWVAQGRLGIAFDHMIDPKLVRKPVSQSKYEPPRYLKPADGKRSPLRKSPRSR